MQKPRFLALVVLAAMSVVSSAAAETAVPVGPFRSVALHDGGHVLVRQGRAQRVTIVSGDGRCTRVHVDDDQTLVIRKVHGCRRDHHLKIEIVTPELSAASVSNGGTIRTVGTFAPQSAIEASVEQGGTVDIRSIAADTVEATVYSGGGIFTTARQVLTASIESGGHITYWGDARVRESVRDGGVVKRGTPADLVPRDGR